MSAANYGTDWRFADDPPWDSPVWSQINDPLRPPETDEEPWAPPLTPRHQAHLDRYFGEREYAAPPRRNHRWLIAALAVLALIAWRKAR